MINIGTPTFDQLKIFLTVVETGSFAGAGRRLNRATSVISYGIANLEAQLGLPLFERQGTKRPQLTMAGRAVLAETRAIGQGMDGLKAKVKGLLEGVEGEVNLAVDVMLPPKRLAAVLRAFSEAFPTVSFCLHVEALGAVTALVLDGTAAIGVSGPLATEIEGIHHIAIGSVPLVPVAAANHPLATAPEIYPGMGRNYVQLVLTDRSPLTAGRDFSVIGHQTWRLADLGAKHALLREGIGWGNMPLHMVAEDLAAGTLVRLKLPEDLSEDYRLSGIYRSDAPPGPAAAWLLQKFIDGK
jgi:DNA-binding transcriptional LysR family regulator